MNIEYVVSEYEKYNSIRETARTLGLSCGVVRKCLITKGVLSTPLSNRVSELLEDGVSPREISDMLKISVSCVGANSPYTKGNYFGDEKTKNAVAIQRCRKK